MCRTCPVASSCTSGVHECLTADHQGKRSAWQKRGNLLVQRPLGDFGLEGNDHRATPGRLRREDPKNLARIASRVPPDRPVHPRPTIDLTYRGYYRRLSYTAVYFDR
jgi:hypothetical protein